MLKLLIRARIALVLLLAVLALCAAFGFFRVGGSLFGTASLEITAAFLVLAAGAWLHLRHSGLAALVLATMLPGVLSALALTALFPQAPLEAPTLLLAILPGYAFASFAASRIARRMSQNEAPQIGARRALIEQVLPALGALLACEIVIAGRAQIWAALTVSAICGLCAIGGVPLLARSFAFGEDFVVRTNRVRESRQRWLALLAPVTEPRWGLSLAGVAVVTIALGYFESNMRLRFGLINWIGLAALVAMAFAATRDWRRAMAATLSLVPPGILALWCMAQMGGADAGWRTLAEALGLGAALIVLLSATAAATMRKGDDAATSSLRVLEEQGAAIVFVVLSAVLAVLAFAPTYRDMLPAALALAALCVAALAFLPAFTSALESVFPRRETIAARYRVP